MLRNWRILALNIRRGLSSDFARKHIGILDKEAGDMLKLLGFNSLDELIEKATPASIRLNRQLDLPPAITEQEMLKEATHVASKNRVWRSFLGQGYHNTMLPSVILRNVFENAGWVTQYTPYQAEISQGRMESLVNFQTIVAELTAMDIANASLLDEASAAAEAVGLMTRQTRRRKVLIDANCHPQVIAVIKTFSQGFNVETELCNPLDDANIQELLETKEYSGVIVSYPDTNGAIRDLSGLVEMAHASKSLVGCVTDLHACAMSKPPGEYGVDVVVGNAQRFGVPLNFGGPHAGFMSCRKAYVKNMPGRLIGISKDKDGHEAFRLSLQTREQFIRKDRATSNICTAQALLANMAAMYVLYHGADGVKDIGRRVADDTKILAAGILDAGHELVLPEGAVFFDTVKFHVNSRVAYSEMKKRANNKEINLRWFNDTTREVGISLDETVDEQDLHDLLYVVGSKASIAELTGKLPEKFDLTKSNLIRTSRFLMQNRFRQFKSELSLVRYIKSLECRDFSLTSGMIPLGSCTMKLTASTELIPCSFPAFANIHPFVPRWQTHGYVDMLMQLESYLCELTGYDGICFQPKAGAAGEYTSLRAIQAYHKSKGEEKRKICLIPDSAHGTNPATAAMSGYKVQYVKTTSTGAVDLDHLKATCEKYKDTLGCLMITYPSTCGVFDDNIREICDLIHDYGGQVFLDGANFNAQMGICRPADIGSDASHFNLHKTFCIPHGGGGPGSGPVGVRNHLLPFMPTHPTHMPYSKSGSSFGTVSSSTYGSPAIIPISWAFIRMMGADGLLQASRTAILSANYMAKRLEGAFIIKYRNRNNLCAHEFIVDLKPFRVLDVTPTDIGKRLQDYGCHAPTVSFPYIHGLMIEPTESENLVEIDRYCDALLSIRQEIAKIESGEWDRANNPIKQAPHSLACVTSDTWDRPYSRQVAAYPAPFVRPGHKFWPKTSRIDDAWGDLNFKGRF